MGILRVNIIGGNFMARKPREKTEEAIYHVYSRGHNKEPIFFDDGDKIRFLETLQRYKNKYNFKIYTYCLMTNHYHIVVNPLGQDISRIMHSINTSYAMYMNKKYSHCGGVFQDRFKSKILYNDSYLLACSAYIHRNPIRAKITEHASEYKWSSFNVFTGEIKDKYGIVEPEYVLEVISINKKAAINEYIMFVEEFKDEKMEDIEMDVYMNTDMRFPMKAYKMEDVLEEVCKQFSNTKEEITAKYSKRNSMAKKIALYMLNIKCRISHKEIAKVFDICPSGVGHEIRRCIEQMRSNEEIKEKADKLMAYLT
jgi:REP element-mobilizing transposase RayT